MCASHVGADAVRIRVLYIMKIGERTRAGVRMWNLNQTAAGYVLRYSNSLARACVLLVCSSLQRSEDCHSMRCIPANKELIML